MPERCSLARDSRRDLSKTESSSILPPRLTWPDEARDLTPWVVDHLPDLGDKLGIILKFTRQGGTAGRFPRRHRCGGCGRP